MSSIGITLTGADEKTPIAGLIRLADMGAEIGFLYTFSPDGRNRYPRNGWIIDAARALGGRVAIHVCGKRARASLLRGNLDYLFLDAARVQVNGQLTAAEVRTACAGLNPKTVITQYPDGSPFAEIDSGNHAILVDASGGRGKLPAEWAWPDTEKPVGFAGGLGPTNLSVELPKIAAVARGDWWIDMENGLRTNDWFDVDKALVAVVRFMAWREAK